MAKKRPRRLQLDISADLERKLILWSHVRDQKLTPWARYVLRIRADENWTKVQAEIEERAARLEISPEEYANRVLEQNNFDFDREKDELENGLSDEDD